MEVEKNSFANISFVDDAQMKKLNKKYKGKDYPTDVLSFEINEKTPEGKNYIGDIVVNIDQAKRQAKEYKNTTEEEIAELVAHGTLHLQGFHHDGD